jgi:type IV pilus assembly protein PilN
MPRINLLPWREQQLNERKMAFTVGLGAATVGAVLAAGAAWLFFSGLIDSQNKRNTLLTNEIKELDKQIEEINSLEDQKQRFVARMQIIEKLQRSRPEIVHVFDTFVSTLPDGTYLTGITQTGQRFKIKGVAQSSTRVSTFMRNIDASQWLKNPELEVVESKKDNPLGSDFTMFADQVATLIDEEKPAAPGAAPARRPRS